MSMIWLPLKLVLGGVTLAGFAALGFGLGTTAGLCSACCCAGPQRAKGSQAETVTDRGTAGPGAKPARGAGRALRRQTKSPHLEDGEPLGASHTHGLRGRGL
jgi:hypothetical protein